MQGHTSLLCQAHQGWQTLTQALHDPSLGAALKPSCAPQASSQSQGGGHQLLDYGICEGPTGG